MKMVLFLFFFLFPGLLSAEIRADQDQVCKTSRCSHHGPAIRFPFWRKDQPRHCRYPGFEISCTEKQQTMLELPYAVKLSVKKINYKSPEIVVHDPEFCLQRQLQNLSLSASPFQFKPGSSSFSSLISDFTFFTCSSNKTGYSFYSIPCRLLPRNPVYAVQSEGDLDELDLSSCSKLFNLSVPDSIFNGKDSFSLIWSESICGNCEKASQKCRLKSNSKEPETECIPQPGKSTTLTLF